MACANADWKEVVFERSNPRGPPRRAREEHHREGGQELHVQTCSFFCEARLSMKGMLSIIAVSLNTRRGSLLDTITVVRSRRNGRVSVHDFSIIS